MSLIPSFFGGGKTNVFDPFSVEAWDPLDGCCNSVANWPATARETSAFVNARIDWKETPDTHVFKADLPGVKKEEVKLRLKMGESSRSADRGARKKRRRKRSGTGWRGAREASFAGLCLPENAKMDEVKASMENGGLTVTIPKLHKEKNPETKSIEISG